MKCLVTGGAGFIGSHLVDKLIEDGNEVIVIDNFASGYMENVNKSATLYVRDIPYFDEIKDLFTKDIDCVYHLAAIARTPQTIDDPNLCCSVNILGTQHVLEASRQAGIKRVVLTSSNVVLAFETPYRVSKETLELLGDCYTKMYGMSVCCVRNSNVFGTRQSMGGPSPNVMAALRKCKQDNGFLEITGDGEQSRDFTHVSDIVSGHIAAMKSDFCGVVDLCTGRNVSLNKIASFYDCPIQYIGERPGDMKHIFQDPDPAFKHLGWRAVCKLEDKIHEVL